MLVFIRINPVHLIITGHDGFRFSFFHGNFKAGEINLPKCPFIQNRTHGHSSRLLTVHREVLDAGIHSFALNASHVGCRHLSRKVRIFRKILEISTAKGASLDI